MTVLTLCLFVTAGCAMRPGFYGKAVTQPKQELVKAALPVPKKTLPVGEQLTFSIRWLGLEAGRTTSTVKGLTEINGRKVYHIEVFSRTSPIVDVLFKVRDYYHSYVDCEDFSTIRFVKKAFEGFHSYDEVYDFDYERGKATFTQKMKDGKEVNKVKEYNIPGKLHDIVSINYWFRLQDVNVGESIKTRLHSDEKNYDVTIKVEAKDTFVNEVGEKIPVILLEPTAKKGEKPFKKGKARIWVTADKERLPLFAELKVIIAGYLNIVLIEKKQIVFTS